MGILLRAGVADFADWGIELLVKQVNFECIVVIEDWYLPFQSEFSIRFLSLGTTINSYMIFGIVSYHSKANFLSVSSLSPRIVVTLHTC